MIRGRAVKPARIRPISWIAYAFARRHRQFPPTRILLRSGYRSGSRPPDSDLHNWMAHCSGVRSAFRLSNFSRMAGSILTGFLLEGSVLGAAGSRLAGIGASRHRRRDRPKEWPVSPGQGPSRPPWRRRPACRARPRLDPGIGGRSASVRRPSWAAAGIPAGRPVAGLPRPSPAPRRSDRLVRRRSGTGGFRDGRERSRVARLHALGDLVQRRSTGTTPIGGEAVLVGLRIGCPPRRGHGSATGRRMEAVHPRRQDLVGPIVRAGEDRPLLAAHPVGPERARKQLALGRILRIDQPQRRVQVGSHGSRGELAGFFAGTSWNGPS